MRRHSPHPTKIVAAVTMKSERPEHATKPYKAIRATPKKKAPAKKVVKKIIIAAPKKALVRKALVKKPVSFNVKARTATEVKKTTKNTPRIITKKVTP